jgi:hypothetical protein
VAKKQSRLLGGLDLIASFVQQTITALPMTEANGHFWFSSHYANCGIGLTGLFLLIDHQEYNHNVLIHRMILQNWVTTEYRTKLFKHRQTKSGWQNISGKICQEFENFKHFNFTHGCHE